MSLNVKILKKYFDRNSVFLFFLIVIFIAFIYFLVPRLVAVSYEFEDGKENVTINSVNDKTKKDTNSQILANDVSTTTNQNLSSSEQLVAVSHVKIPEQVKAIYMTSWVAGTKSIRDNLVKIIDDTEINSVVIDIKDYSGFVSFEVSDETLSNMGDKEIRIRDIRQFIDSLHKKGVYVIGRISSFQDPRVVKNRPDLAVRRSSDGGIWKDKKGITWIDPGSREMWDYLVALGKASYEVGFDELNFDYIRFPSDGDMTDIKYPFSQNKVKAEVIRDFFSYLKEKLSDTGAVLSADLFGMTTTNTDDLNIGQVLEYALQSMDFVSPMVYPSHYPPTFNGYKNPNAVPYEIIKFCMDRAVERTIATSSIFKLNNSVLITNNTLATSTGTSTSSGYENLVKKYTKESWSKFKIRPWLQDFSLGTPSYGAKEVRAQIEATYDAGLNSWMLWSASNKYTVSALNKD